MPFCAFAGSSTFTGLKYRAISVLVFLSVALMIHSTRKKAIIAVMKSAKAIFQAPPWCSSSCAPWRLTMMICGCGSVIGWA